MTFQPTTRSNFDKIKFKPDKYIQYLLSDEIGFASSEKLGIPKHKAQGMTGYNMMWYDLIWYGMMWYNMIISWFDIIWCDVWYVIWCDMIYDNWLIYDIKGYIKLC